MDLNYIGYKIRTAKKDYKCENCGSPGHQNMEQILFLVSFSNSREKNNNGRISSLILFLC